MDDCFGPFYIKKGRKELKRYGLLFTCMCSRVVHVEMLDYLSTDAFINALRTPSPYVDVCVNLDLTRAPILLVQDKNLLKH